MANDRTNHGSRSVPNLVILVFLIVLLTGVVSSGLIRGRNSTKLIPAPAEVKQASSGEYLFCFWNVENLFDDREDGRQEPDDAYDRWFARKPADRQHKLANLRKALLEMNDGKGPDILAMAEVESVRAAELLQAELNQHLADPTLHYRHLLMKEPTEFGRHIAPALLTRLDVDASRTTLLGNRLRILRTHLRAGSTELVVITSHWTSRISDKTGDRRAKYADQIYGEYVAMHKTNPAVDLIVCGDFNDNPDDPSVTKHLHAVAERESLSGPIPRLWNLSARLDRNQYGTLYYKSWNLFDQLVVSPGMLDEIGWQCDPDSVATFNRTVRAADPLRRPFRFGNESWWGDRGFSDHFAVTVRLRAF